MLSPVTPEAQAELTVAHFWNSRLPRSADESQIYHAILLLYERGDLPAWQALRMLIASGTLDFEVTMQLLAWQARSGDHPVT